MLKLLTIQRLGISHLLDHKLKHNLLDTINPVAVALMLKRILILYVYCTNFLEERTNLLSELYTYNSDALTQTYAKTIDTLLFGNILFHQFENNRICIAAITFIVSLKRFDGPL